MSDLAVTLTVEQLRTLVREAVNDALREAIEPRDLEAPISDDERAVARKRWASKLRSVR
jgi:hypothetical protein